MQLTLPEIPCVTPIGLLELHEDSCRLPFSRAPFSCADPCAGVCAEFALRAERFIDAPSSRAASPMATLAPIATGSVPSGVMGLVRDLDPSGFDPSTGTQHRQEAIMIHSGG